MKLGQIVDVIGGGTPKTSVPEYWNGDILWLSPPDFTNAIRWVKDTNKTITQAGLNNSSAKILKKGDLIISARGTVGALAQLAKPMAFSQTNYGLRAKPEFTNNDFLFYLLKYNLNKIKRLTYGAVFDTITKDTFNLIEINLPPILEQQSIADVLSSLDEKIDLLHRQNKTLEDMAKLLFRKYFIDNPNQEKWEGKPLVYFFDFLEGPGIRNWQYTESGTRFINIRLISNGEINIKKSNFVSNEEANNKYQHFLLQKGDMIVSTSGTLGKTAIVRPYHLPLLLNTSVIRFRPVDKINYSFMYQYLKSKEFQADLNNLGSGSVQKNFGPTHLKTMKLRIPPKELLETFRSNSDYIYKKISNGFCQIHTLEDLRDVLLPKLMSGAVKIKS